ncbi:hypothetical protein AX774_g7190 [Zancudomyces culisetae]|uniref:Uncharacterized protein n=1 Tax=Zancudomyces culisetae TaxID=1213189 RepID=A0A1R1PEG6_ZANCU|nr:hypothetical protein AX774_g7190 [Zancudomyces culisetae]|eukprot:OMH79395.1 hypothetical protein AX774_g7190 [Zancudomyces culisetae]
MPPLAPITLTLLLLLLFRLPPPPTLPSAMYPPLPGCPRTNNCDGEMSLMSTFNARHNTSISNFKFSFNSAVVYNSASTANCCINHGFGGLNTCDPAACFNTLHTNGIATINRPLCAPCINNPFRYISDRNNGRSFASVSPPNHVPRFPNCVRSRELFAVPSAANNRPIATNVSPITLSLSSRSKLSTIR